MEIEEIVSEKQFIRAIKTDDLVISRHPGENPGPEIP